MTPRRPESEAEHARRRRLAAAFGEALPDRTRDELPDRPGEDAQGTGHDDWLRGQVPPHHG